MTRTRSQRATAREAARNEANDAFTAAFASPAATTPARNLANDDAAALPNSAQVVNPPQQQQQPQPPRQRQRRSNEQRQQRRARLPRKVRTAKDNYEPSLREFMNWKLHRVHMQNHIFTRDKLLAITDKEIYRWMKHRVYGDEEADEASSPPLYYRHSSVLFWKKAISHFMPNSHMQWNVDTNTGNPTRSPLVLKLLKHIKRFEVQRRGKKSMKRRPLKAEEYEDTAIEKIYRVYGQSSTVTQVLNCIRQDNKRGGHPDLKVCHL